MEKWFREGEELLKNLRNIQPAEEELAVWNIGQCGIIFKYHHHIYMVDPVLTPMCDENGVSRKHYEAPFAPEADLNIDRVFCTHNHDDHLNKETVRRLAAAHPGLSFTVPAGVLEELDFPFADRICGIRQNETVSLSEDPSEGITVTAIAAPHDHYRTDAVGNEKALGYLFQFGNIVIYHAGDTVASDRLVRELSAQPSIDAAFLPINGRDWIRESRNIIGNMTPQEAALFAASIRCGTVFPTHYDMMMGNEEDPLVFGRYMDRHAPETGWHLLRLGECYLYRKQ